MSCNELCPIHKEKCIVKGTHPKRPMVQNQIVHHHFVLDRLGNPLECSWVTCDKEARKL